MDTALWAIGAGVAAACGLGLLALAWVWAVEKVVDAFGFSKIVTSWYVDKLIKERDAKRVPA